MTVRGVAAKAELTPIEVSEYERGVRRPGLDNLIRYLRGVGADLCTLQALLDEKSKPLVATTDEEAIEDWRELRAALERALSDETLERRVRSILEELGWDSRSLVMDARSTAADKTEIPVYELLPAHVRSSQKALDPVVRIGNRLGLTEGQRRDEVRAAKRQVREIVRLDPRRRCSKIRGASSRFRGPLFGVLLLEEARRAIPADPAESLSLADAVHLSCKRTSRDQPDPEVSAAALAVRGNAKRALGRLREAEDDLAKASALLDTPGVVDPALPAEVESYLGSLRRDQGRLEDAARHLRRAGTLYGVLGEREKAARVLLKLGLVDYYRQDFQDAVAAAEEALKLLDENSEGWLRAYAHYDLAHNLHGGGAVDRAEAELAAHEELLAAGGQPLAQLVVWLRARIAWSRGDLGAAERGFADARSRALALGHGYDAALIALELALVHLSQGRTARVKTLAVQALQELAEEEEVEREVRAAMALVAEAARQEELTREVVADAVALLERGRRPGRAARPETA